MMFRLIVARLAAAFVPALLVCGAATASEIGYVDMQQVLERSALGKAAQAELEERFGEEQQAFAQEEAAIRQMQRDLERDRPLMSKAQVEKKEQEIQARIEQFEQDFSKIRQKLIQAQQKAGQEIMPPAREAVLAVAKERELDAVFEASEAGVLYLDEDGDITDAVIEALDRRSE
jgi:outer membrane protein